MPCRLDLKKPMQSLPYLEKRRQGITNCFFIIWVFKIVIIFKQQRYFLSFTKYDKGAVISRIVLIIRN